MTARSRAAWKCPSAGWVRKYRARLFGKVTQADLDKLATGITIAGVAYGPIVADIERSKGMYSWATVSLKEGKNREVKRVMESLGLKVARLIRMPMGRSSWAIWRKARSRKSPPGCGASSWESAARNAGPKAMMRPGKNRKNPKRRRNPAPFGKTAKEADRSRAEIRRGRK